ncbi:hypothetical protein AB6806_28065 [Bosea sp. RCC_152_1]|uniref:hypothetical protein n=1 Tax=Bosea sp. RCC_152_1 TaxID=3239228 RepID=UPI003523920C
MTGRAIRIRQAASAMLGPLVWALHFIVVYGLESQLCKSSAGYAHTVLLAAASVAAALALVMHAARQMRALRSQGVRGFLAQTALALDGLSLLAIGLVFVSGLALPACGYFL